MSERLQAILAEFLQHKLGQSLERMDESLEKWRAGEMGVFEAHKEVLKHAARAERLASRVADAGDGPLDSLLRDAFDMGAVSRDEFIEFTGSTPEDVDPSPGLDDGLSMPLKRDLVRELLAQGPVLIHIDARMPGVSVPLQLSRDPRLVLRFGYNLTPEITDLEVDDKAISGTLTFSGVPHHCILPWPVVYAVVSEEDKRGMVWPEDVPKVVLQEMAGQQSKLPTIGADEHGADGRELSTVDASGREKTSAKKRARHLKLVD